VGESGKDYHLWAINSELHIQSDRNLTITNPIIPTPSLRHFSPSTHIFKEPHIVLTLDLTQTVENLTCDGIPAIFISGTTYNCTIDLTDKSETVLIERGLNVTITGSEDIWLHFAKRPVISKITALDNKIIVEGSDFVEGITTCFIGEGRIPSETLFLSHDRVECVTAVT